MFKLILLITAIVVSLIIVYIYFKKDKLNFNNDVIKYKCTSNFKYTTVKLSDIKEFDIFFTPKRWSTKNNNYILFKDNYYIIEPGYYYYINNCKMIVNNDINVNLIKM